MYITNLVSPLVLAAISIIKTASFATFLGSHTFPCRSHYQVLTYLMICISVNCIRMLIKLCISGNYNIVLVKDKKF